MLVSGVPGSLEQDQITRLPLPPPEKAAVRRAFLELLQEWWRSGLVESLSYGVLLVHLKEGYVELHGLSAAHGGMTARAVRKAIGQYDRVAEVRAFPVIDFYAGDLSDGSQRRIANILTLRQFREFTREAPEPAGKSKGKRCSTGKVSRKYWAEKSRRSGFQQLHANLDAALLSDPEWLREGHNLVTEVLAEPDCGYETMIAATMAQYGSLLGFDVFAADLVDPSIGADSEIRGLWFSPCVNQALVIAVRTHTPPAADDLGHLITRMDRFTDGSAIGPDGHRLLVIVRPEHARKYEQVAVELGHAGRVRIVTPQALVLLCAVLHKLRVPAHDVVVRLILPELRCDTAVGQLAESCYPGHSSDRCASSPGISRFHSTVEEFLSGLPGSLSQDDLVWRRGVYDLKSPNG